MLVKALRQHIGKVYVFDVLLDCRIVVSRWDNDVFVVLDVMFIFRI